MTKVKDPDCGMEIDMASAESCITYLVQTYYFCSEECRKTFKATPHEVINRRPFGFPAYSERSATHGRVQRAPGPFGTCSGRRRT